MALEAFLNSNGQLAIPLINRAGGILEFPSPGSLLKNEEHLDFVLGVAQVNTNLASDVMNSTIVGKSSTSRYADAAAVAHLSGPTGDRLRSDGNTEMEPYINLSSATISFATPNAVNVFSTDDTSPYLCQGGQQAKEKQQLTSTIGSTDLYKTKLQTGQNAIPARIKQNRGTLTPMLKKPRLDVNQENIQQQEIIQELLLKDLQGFNPQLNATIKQHREQIQLQQPILHSALELRGYHLQLQDQQMISFLQDQHNQQGTLAPLLDVGICSQRLKQYLYHLQYNTHDNGIAYWKEFVSEYYAPGSKKRRHGVVTLVV